MRSLNCTRHIETSLICSTTGRARILRRRAEATTAWRIQTSRLRAECGRSRHFRAGVTGGFTEINVGPGTHESRVYEQFTRPTALVNTEFGPRIEPGTVGIDRQTDFLQGGVFAQFDYRDIPGGPRSGGNYLARFTYNKDVDLRQHTHRRLELEAQQYIPFFNQRRVIALRARSELTYKNRNQTLPFYMQPTLGGSNDLRGFPPVSLL